MRDAVAAGAVTVGLVVLVAVPDAVPTTRQWLLVAGIPCAVAVRRTWPVASWLGLVVLAAAGTWLDRAGADSSSGLLVVLMGAYAVVAYGPRWCGVPLVLPVSAAAAALDSVVTGEPLSQQWPDALTAVVAVTLAVGLGSAVRTMRRTAEQLAAQGEQLQARNAVLEELAVVEAENATLVERARIAREVHDVLAHHMVAVQIHAQVATRFFERRPDKSRVALGHLRDNSAAATAALRRLLGHPARPGSADPQPTLADLPDLVASLAPLGVDVEVRTEIGTPPPDVQLAIYRVVQEALTNAVRHGGCRTARVVVRGVDGGIRVTVDDDGRSGVGPDEAREGAGHGLRGMRERVALHGGKLDLSVGELGGWRVAATFGRAPS